MLSEVHQPSMATDQVDIISDDTIHRNEDNSGHSSLLEPEITRGLPAAPVDVNQFNMAADDIISNGTSMRNGEKSANDSLLEPEITSGLPAVPVVDANSLADGKNRGNGENSTNDALQVPKITRGLPDIPDVQSDVHHVDIATDDVKIYDDIVEQFMDPTFDDIFHGNGEKSAKKSLQKAIIAKGSPAVAVASSSERRKSASNTAVTSLRNKYLAAVIVLSVLCVLLVLAVILVYLFLGRTCSCQTIYNQEQESTVQSDVNQATTVTHPVKPKKPNVNKPRPTRLPWNTKPEVKPIMPELEASTAVDQEVTSSSEPQVDAESIQTKVSMKGYLPVVIALPAICVPLLLAGILVFCLVGKKSKKTILDKEQSLVEQSDVTPVIMATDHFNVIYNDSMNEDGETSANETLEKQMLGRELPAVPVALNSVSQEDTSADDEYQEVSGGTPTHVLQKRYSAAVIVLSVLCVLLVLAVILVYIFVGRTSSSQTIHNQHQKIAGCATNWKTVEGQSSPGGLELIVASLELCQSVCEGMYSCKAVDYSHSLGICWLHTQFGVKQRDATKNQYQLNKRCVQQGSPKDDEPSADKS